MYSMSVMEELYLESESISRTQKRHGMKRRKNSLQALDAYAISKAEQRRIKGGHVNIPGGTGSTGLIGWDEIDIRANDQIATGRGTLPRVLQWLFR